MTVKSRTLFSFADDSDGSASDNPSSCGYHSMLLNWLTGGFSRRQQSATTWVDVPPVDDANNGTEVDVRPSADEVHDETHNTLIDVVVTDQHNKTWTMKSASPSGIVSTELNVMYTTTADVISVLE